jgi:hypothetical protein
MISLSAQVMHNMSKLMEEGHHILMRQEGWLLSGWFIKACDHYNDWLMDLSTEIGSLDQLGDRCVPHLVVSRIQVKIEVTHHPPCSMVFSLVQFDILMPCLSSLQPCKLEPKKFLVNVHGFLGYLLHREVLL